MTIKPHITDFYIDGYNTVTFCKICSAEGLGLVEDCNGFEPAPCLVDKLPVSECKALSCRQNNRCCWQNHLTKRK